MVGILISRFGLKSLMWLCRVKIWTPVHYGLTKTVKTIFQILIHSICQYSSKSPGPVFLNFTEIWPAKINIRSVSAPSSDFLVVESHHKEVTQNQYPISNSQNIQSNSNADNNIKNIDIVVVLVNSSKYCPDNCIFMWYFFSHVTNRHQKPALLHIVGIYVIKCNE